MLKSVSPHSENMLDTLDMLYVTGSFVSNNLKDKVLHHLTKNLYVAYGTNECSTATLLQPFNQELSMNGSVGYPLTYVDVEVVNDYGQILNANEVGTIRIKSPAMITHYLNDQDATNKSFREGWFYPGDLGKMTDDGQLVYMGRSDHMMIMNGINIYPGEIEQVILTHPAVKDAAAIPLKAEVEQDIPICAVELNKDTLASQKQLLNYASQHLSSRSPKMVVIVAKIPRNIQGKLERDKLKQLIKLSLIK
jgi:acyl-coenzyme A synthetase/AMP-(fatty) acid ligase